MDRAALLCHIGRFLAAVDAEEGYLFGSRARGDALTDSDVDLVVIADRFAGIPFPRRLVMLQENWHFPYFLEALPYTRAELERLAPSRGVVHQALRHGIRVMPENLMEME